MCRSIHVLQSAPEPSCPAALHGLPSPSLSCPAALHGLPSPSLGPKLAAAEMDAEQLQAPTTQGQGTL